MTSDEFAQFRTRSIQEYATAHVAAGDWPAADGEARAAAEFEALLPSGAETPGMLLLTATAGPGAVVGWAWLALEGRPPASTAWLYDVEVEAGRRGTGYGRAILAAVEATAADQGATSIGLNVFAGNVVARSLYESAGYAVTSAQMRKPLGDDDHRDARGDPPGSGPARPS